MVTARTRVLIKFTYLLTLNNLKHAEDNRVCEIYNIYVAFWWFM